MTLKWFFFTVKADFFTLKFSFALFVFSEIFGNTTLTFPFGSLFLLIGSVFQWDGTKVSSRQGAVVAGSGRDKSRIRSQWRKFSLKKGEIESEIQKINPIHGIMDYDLKIQNL